MPHSCRLGGSGRSFNATHQARRQIQGKHEQYAADKFLGLPDFSNADGSRIDITSSAVNSSRGRAAAQVVLGMFVFSTAASLVSASTGSKSSSGSKPSSSGDGNKGSKSSSSAKGGIQKGGVQFDDFQGKGFSNAGDKGSKPVSSANSKGAKAFNVNYVVHLPDLKKEGVSYSSKGTYSREVFSTSNSSKGTHSLEVFEGKSFQDLNFEENVDKLKTWQRYSAPSHKVTVEASYNFPKVTAPRQDAKCDYMGDIFGRSTSYYDYKGQLTSSPQAFFRHLPRTLSVLPYYNNDFPARSGYYFYDLPDKVFKAFKGFSEVSGVPEAREKSLRSQDDNGRSIFDILCVVNPKGASTIQAFRPDILKYSDTAGVPSIFYAFMASEGVFGSVMLNLAEDKNTDSVGDIILMIKSQLKDKRDLFDNPGETLASIASSLHRDVNEAYNAYSAYLPDSGYAHRNQNDYGWLYTLPFPCACEGVASSGAFKACAKDYVGLVADMKKAGILFRKSVKLPDGGDASFKKSGPYTAVSPGSESKSSYEVPVTTKANAKAISDYFTSNPQAFDKWMEIKEQVKNDGVAEGGAVQNVETDYEGFLKYLDTDYEALSDKNVLEGLSENFSKNLALLRKVLNVAVENNI